MISPFGGRTGPIPADQFEGLRRFPGADLASEVEALRKEGSRVEVITPDADSRAAMGTNQMVHRFNVLASAELYHPATTVPANPKCLARPRRFRPC